MSKKYLARKCAMTAATGMIAALLAAPAYAETTPTAPKAQAENKPADDKAEQAKMFSEHKKVMLEKIAEHIADMQKRQSCVQAANDIEAMRACLKRDGAESSHTGDKKLTNRAPALQASTKKSAEPRIR
jgi:hypothetical protein